MNDPIILDDEQERDARRIAVEPTCAALDASTLSAGKTPVAVRVAQLRNARVILVTGPLNTRPGWKSTFERMGVDLPFYWIRNSKDGKAALSKLQFHEEGVYFIGPEYATGLNWDQVKRPDGTPARSDTGKLIKRKNGLWSSIHPDLFIIDEIHRGTSNAQSQRYKAFMGMQADFKLGLSGTPHGNEFIGIYPVTKVLWPDHVPESSGQFMQQYVSMRYDPWPKFSGVGNFARFKRKWCAEGTCQDETHLHGTPGEELVPGAYFASLPCVVRRVWEYEGVIDEQDVLVELSPIQRKAYDQLEKSMVTMLTGNPLVIELPSTLRIRLRQATLGMFHVTEEGSIEFAPDCQSSKLDALRGVLTNDFQGEPALIATDSARFAKVLVRRLGDLGPTEEWSGAVKPAERDAIKERFIAGQTRYVVMVIKSGGTGTDLLQIATRNVAWVSVDDSRVENIQFLGRVVRRGQGDLVRIRHLVGVNTYDQGIISEQLKKTLAMNESMRVAS